MCLTASSRPDMDLVCSLCTAECTVRTSASDPPSSPPSAAAPLAGSCAWRVRRRAAASAIACARKRASWMRPCTFSAVVAKVPWRCMPSRWSLRSTKARPATPTGALVFNLPQASWSALSACFTTSIFSIVVATQTLPCRRMPSTRAAWVVISSMAASLTPMWAWSSSAVSHFRCWSWCLVLVDWSSTSLCISRCGADCWIFCRTTSGSCL
mmetsp:Transcript_131681/g.328357  ORF Transcript_131681/g.328357 Transcript_131681/m.328357 type:complete len:211 (+) Transcript_131681:50-682(+)